MCQDEAFPPGMKHTPWRNIKHTQAACLHVVQTHQRCTSWRTVTSCCNRTHGAFCHACGMIASSADHGSMTLVCRKTEAPSPQRKSFMCQDEAFPPGLKRTPWRSFKHTQAACLHVFQTHQRVHFMADRYVLLQQNTWQLLPCLWHDSIGCRPWQHDSGLQGGRGAALAFC